MNAHRAAEKETAPELPLPRRHDETPPAADTNRLGNSIDQHPFKFLGVGTAATAQLRSTSMAPASSMDVVDADVVVATLFAGRDPEAKAAVLAAWREGWRSGYCYGLRLFERGFESCRGQRTDRNNNSAITSSWQALVSARGEYEVSPGRYLALPRSGDYSGGPVVWSNGERGCDE